MIHLNWQKNLDSTCRVLTSTKEELKNCQYILMEKEFIISEQKKSGSLFNNTFY